MESTEEGFKLTHVPERVADEFNEWARREFGGNTGMALKWLWEGRLEAAQLRQEIASLAARIDALEHPTDPQPTMKFRTLDGKTHQGNR